MSAPTVPDTAITSPAPAPLDPAALQEPAPRPRVDSSPDSLAAIPVKQPVAPPARLVSLDAYRGFIMLAMASGGLGLPQVVRELSKTPEGQAQLVSQPWWRVLALHTDHVPWVGCSFWDLIQPAFMFMVGVALPYSLASRLAKGDAPGKIYGHALLRSLILVLLAIFLSSNWDRHTNFIFTNVLAQIGLGYTFLYFLVNRGLRVQLLAVAAILGGYWLWFYAYSAPAAGFDYTTVGARPDYTALQGLFAHWNMNVNAAAAFDQWFLNLFPRESAFVFNRGGYQTLNFVPSLATMIFGLMAGELLRSRDYTDVEKWVRLIVAGIGMVAAGWVLGQTVCPLVKRIWTPSWAIYSTGFVLLMLAGFYLVIDLWGYQRWAWALVVVGMNSIAMYCMAQLLKPWTANTLKIHLGQSVFDGTYCGWQVFAPAFAPFAQAAMVLCVWWLICVWMYRQKIFIRI